MIFITYRIEGYIHFHKQCRLTSSFYYEQQLVKLFIYNLMEYGLCVETFWINIEVLDEKRRGKMLKII